MRGLDAMAVEQEVEEASGPEEPAGAAEAGDPHTAESDGPDSGELVAVGVAGKEPKTSRLKRRRGR